MFRVLSKAMVYGHFFFAEATATCITYLDILEQWLWPQLKDFPGFLLFQQDGEPPHCYLAVRAFFSNQVPKSWVQETDTLATKIPKPVTS